MKLPNNGWGRATAEHLSSPNETSITGTDLHLIELLAKEVPWEPPNNKAVAKTIHCSPKTGDKTLLLKRTPIQLIDHREIELVSIQSLTSTYYWPCYKKVFCMLPKEKHKGFVKLTTNPLIYNCVLPVAKACGITQPISDLTEDSCHEMEPIPNYCLDDQEPETVEYRDLEQNQINISVQKHGSKMTQWHSAILIDQLVPPSSIIREISSCSRWEQMQIQPVII